jgi:hypothetical protein
MSTPSSTSEFLDRHVTYEPFTPAKAAKILEMNLSNRNLRDRRVMTYATAMKRGQWREDAGDPIRLSQDNILLDGQHRLWAVVESGVTISFLVLRDLPSDVMPVIDKGLGRSNGDSMTWANVLNASHSSAAAKLYLAYVFDLVPTDSKKADVYISTQDMVEWALDNNERLQWSIHRARKANTALGGSTAAWTVLLLIALDDYDEAKVEEFMDPVITGASLAKGDPRLALRNWTINRSSRRMHNDRHVMLGTGIRAFNRWAEGKSMISARQWQRGDEFPRLAGPKRSKRPVVAP